MSLTMPKTVKRNKEKWNKNTGSPLLIGHLIKEYSDVVSISILSSQGKQCHSNYNEGTNSSAVIPDCTHSGPAVLYVCM